ncbi:MAG: preprotein translocase subunit SecG [Gammaproteobacteria bacterium]
MLQTIITVVHVFLAVGIIALVLLQRGKGAEAGAAFGAGASGTVFGSKGSASFLSRTTAVLATLFFVTSLGLAFLAGQRTEPTSVIETAPTQAPAEAPGALPLPETGDELPALPETPGETGGGDPEQ